MNKRPLAVIAVLLSLLVALPALAQRGPSWEDNYGRTQGPGMGQGMMGSGMMGSGMMGSGMMGSGMMNGGMMGNLIAPEVPNKLPTPKSQEWTQKLRDVLALERLSYDQYTADAEKFNAHMPYDMVIGQEEDHILAIERLFSAYGLPATGKQPAITKTKTITEALEVCVKLEKDLIPRYEWLVQNAEDRESAAVINEILLQTRHHLVMFEHALRMGGGMGGMGSGMMR